MSVFDMLFFFLGASVGLLTGLALGVLICIKGCE